MADLASQTFSLAIGQAKTLVVTMDTPPAGGVGSWAMRFRLRVPGATTIEKASGAGVTCTDATNGVWEIALGRADTIGLPAKPLAWSFWDTAAGEESPVAIGTVEPYRTAENP